MAAAPRKDIKNAPIRAKEPAEAARQAHPAAAPQPPDGGSLDVFDRVAPATGAAATAGAAREAASARLEPTLTPPSTGQQGATEKGDAGATPVAAAKPAATAAADIREAAKGRVESAIKEDPDDPADGPKEPRTDLGGVPAGIADLSGGGDRGVPTRTGESDDAADSPAPSRDSGRAALAAQVDAVLGGDEQAASAPTGSTVGSAGSSNIGRKGTPADLGMTGDSGGRGSQTSIGMDVFDTARPATGAVSASGELGILQGMVPTSGADANGRPSVAKGDAALAAAIAHAGTPEGQQETATNAGVTPPSAAPESARATPSDDDVPEQGFLSELVANGPTAAITEWLKSATLPPNQSEMDQFRDVNDGLGRGLGTVGFAEGAKQQGIKNLETAVHGALGAGAKGGKPGASQPVDPETAGHPELTDGYMAWRAAGRARLGLGTPLDGEGDVDPAREGTDTATSGSGPTDNVTVGLMDKAWREFLIGQPGPDQAVSGGGRVDPTAGTRPGDMGNIDFGPDSTGAWSGETRTEEPEDALNSLGGSGLSIEDANQGASSDSDSESDEESSDSESEEI